jgi:hypothetical protein
VTAKGRKKGSRVESDDEDEEMDEEMVQGLDDGSDEEEKEMSEDEEEHSDAPLVSQFLSDNISQLPPPLVTTCVMKPTNDIARGTHAYEILSSLQGPHTSPHRRSGLQVPSISTPSQQITGYRAQKEDVCSKSERKSKRSGYFDAKGTGTSCIQESDSWWEGERPCK